MTGESEFRASAAAWPARRAAGRTRGLLVPLALWHLLSLDAPTVAVLWTVFLARLTHTRLSLETGWAMGLAVWILYAGDRLVDTRHLGREENAGGDDELEARHAMHHRYRGWFRGGIGVASIGLAMLLPYLPVVAMRLYLTEGALLAGYLLLIYSAPTTGEQGGRAGRLVPKELLVGPFFAAATFIPTLAASPALRRELMPCAVLLAALCSLNCLFIYAWEHPAGGASGTVPHPATTVALRHLPAAAWGVLVSGAAVGLMDGARGASARLPFGLVCAGSAAILLAVHSRRGEFSRLGLRVAADAALLTPLLVLALLR